MPTDIKTGQPIYAGAPSVGLRNVGSYQVSGEPWISGSEEQAASKVKRFSFPFVSREVTVSNFGAAAIRVHFASGSGHDFSDKHGPINQSVTSDVYVGLHYVPVSGSGTTTTFRAKTKEVYVTTTAAGVGTYRVMADLTNVPRSRMYHLTGSGHTHAGSSVNAAVPEV